MSYKNKKTGKRKDFTKDELINKLLELNNTLNLDDIKEDKLEKKTSKSKKKISKEKKSGNNETLGISAEVAFCKTYNLNYPHHLDERCDESTCNNLMQICELIKKEHTFEVVEHIGSDNGPVDFKLSNNKTLSLKTLKSDKGKICPQKIGQPTRKSWDTYFTNFGLKLSKIEDTNDEYFITITTKSGNKKKFHKTNELERKKWIKENIDTVISEMFKYLICCCDNIIIIIKTKDEFQYAYFPKQNIIQFDKDKFTYINNCLDGEINENTGKVYEGTGVKYNNITLGEFQFHNNRDNIKFRFYYKGLLELLQNNKSE